MGEQRTITFSYTEFSNDTELDAEDKNLLDRARLALKKAYAPYSKFNVGAALLMEDGTIIEGNNQENVAYPSGLCAERVALYYAGAQFPDQHVVKIAISAQAEEFDVDYPITPCGACRQALLEYETNAHAHIQVILAGASGKVIKVPSVRSMLPLSFNEQKLKK